MAQESRYHALFEQWRNMHGYEIKDLCAVLSYLQYLEMCCSHRCTELVATDDGISGVCVCCGADLGLANLKAVSG